jgi:hypothetical protein
MKTNTKSAKTAPTRAWLVPSNAGLLPPDGACQVIHCYTHEPNFPSQRVSVEKGTSALQVGRRGHRCQVHRPTAHETQLTVYVATGAAIYSGMGVATKLTNKACSMQDQYQWPTNTIGLIVI